MTKKQGDNGKISGGMASFRLEANRSTKGLSILLSGIIGVRDFSDEEITLLSHGGKIIVIGKKLFISVYENGNVEIQGKVLEIKFCYGKN